MPRRLDKIASTLELHLRRLPARGGRGRFPELLPRVRFSLYLHNRPRLRKQLNFEVDRPNGSSGHWLAYDHWPNEWKNRLFTFYQAYCDLAPLPLDDPLPLSNDAGVTSDGSRLGYRSVQLARDVYLAQVAHAIWLDMADYLPWKLEDWSDHELGYLLCSKVLFRAFRTFDDDELFYVVYAGSRSEATENILGDPRVARAFLLSEPEQGECLVGDSPEQTCQRLSAWLHDYLWHNPGGFAGLPFHRDHPLLEHRLQRHSVGSLASKYVTTAGCGSASSLFADLARSVNIPVRKVTNAIDDFSGDEEHHIGLVFNWQGGGQGRYLLHTDDLYNSSYFRDPAPVPVGTGRGVALWDHVWLSPGDFGSAFSYDPRAEIFGKATSDQQVAFWTRGDWLVRSARAVGEANSEANHDVVVESLEAVPGISPQQAEACWQAVADSILAYGDGDWATGCQVLDERHAQWCARTDKC